jgi:hypothetical protein
MYWFRQGYVKYPQTRAFATSGVSRQEDKTLKIEVISPLIIFEARGDERFCRS